MLWLHFIVNREALGRDLWVVGDGLLTLSSKAGVRQRLLVVRGAFQRRGVVEQRWHLTAQRSPSAAFSSFPQAAPHS